MVAFNRVNSCFPSWKREERLILAGMITIGACSFLGKLILFVLVRLRPQFFGGYTFNTWQSRFSQDQRPERRLIAEGGMGHETERLYFDHPEAEGATAERPSGDGEERALETG
ncbi:hypothetical protein MMC08_006164 [Hypocenomyce scalaris]|nr:hypothetical protein [Hypocenomyce scalaris]